MDIFMKELRQRHKASIAGLYKRHKSGVGYAIMVLGVIAALLGVNKALNQGDERAEKQAAVICENTTRQDRQTLANLRTKSSKEIIKSLHLSEKVVKDSVAKQLRLSAEQRKALQPSSPRSACSSKITTLTPTKSATHTGITGATGPTTVLHGVTGATR